MPRHISDAGLALVRRFEGFRSHAYLCPAGVWTIGYGSTRGVTKDTPPITEQEAEERLRSDLHTAEQSVGRLIRVPLHQLQFDALVCFTFNLGGGALQRSTLRQKVNRGEHRVVPDELIKWCRAGGRKLPGLVRRRAAEAHLYLDGCDAGSISISLSAHAANGQAEKW